MVSDLNVMAVIFMAIYGAEPLLYFGGSNRRGQRPGPELLPADDPDLHNYPHPAKDTVASNNRRKSGDIHLFLFLRPQYSLVRFPRGIF